MVDDLRGAITGGIRPSTPEPFTGVFIHRQNAAIRLCADMQEHPVTVQNRRGGETPGGHLRLMLLHHVHLPMDLAGLCIETSRHARGTQCIGATVMQGHGGTRPVAILHAAINSRPALRPDLLPGIRRITNDAFSVRRLLGPVQDIHASTADRHAAIPAPNAGLPELLRFLFGKVSGQALRVPGTISRRTTPAGPVGGGGRQGEQKEEQGDFHAG